MSSQTIFNFKNIWPDADNPSRSQHVRSPQNGAEANPFSSVSDGCCIMEIDSDMCYVFNSSRIDSKSNFNSSEGHMDKANLVSEVFMKINVEGERESEKVETNATKNLFALGAIRQRSQHRQKSRTRNKTKIGHLNVHSAYHGNCQACAEFRSKGNEAHCNNDFLKAQEYYTLGIESIRANESSECCLKSLSLCYSDRAAAKVSLGRIREALADALMAIQLDPGFPEDLVRAANCHLLLGEVDHALKSFNVCLESKSVMCLDWRVVIDCADGINKAHKVAESTKRSVALLEKRSADAALSAFGIISEALSVSTYSEKLLEMKADALYLLRRYKEATQVCEQSINFAKINSENYQFAKLWRWILISKSYFQLGRFNEALSYADQVRTMQDHKKMETSISAAVTISELLSHKNAGNEAYRAGRYTKAVEHYTTALSSNIGSRPFAAICLCNRAAAHEALGQIMDAIADCSLAIALDENYGKAVSRRATLHEMIRDYVQAASDVQRLLSILEKQSDNNASAEKLQQARRRLPSMKEKAKKGIPLNFNLILGIKPSDTSTDIKKAYRMAALKHHPDKAGQFLGRSENRDEESGRLWKKITAEVQRDADRLFKMIGEAYAVLSDPSKRSEYDFEEEMRKPAKEREEQKSYRERSDFQSHPYMYSSYRPSDFHSTKRTSSCGKPSYSECPSRSSSYRRYGQKSPFERTCPDERESWKSYG